MSISGWVLVLDTYRGGTCLSRPSPVSFCLWSIAGTGFLGQPSVVSCLSCLVRQCPVLALSLALSDTGNRHHPEQIHFTLPSHSYLTLPSPVQSSAPYCLWVVLPSPRPRPRHHELHCHPIYCPVPWFASTKLQPKLYPALNALVCPVQNHCP